MKEFIALHNRTVSRDEIQTVIALAKEQNNTEVIYRLSKILNDHPDSNRFNINIINYPTVGANSNSPSNTALAGTRHSGDYREALDECGRLKKGWHFVDGKVVKVQKRSGLLSQYTEKEFGHPFPKALKEKFKELNWKYDRKNKRYYTPVPENEAEKEQQAQMFAFIEQEKSRIEANGNFPSAPSSAKSAPSASSSNKTPLHKLNFSDVNYNKKIVENLKNNQTGEYDLLKKDMIGINFSLAILEKYLSLEQLSSLYGKEKEKEAKKDYVFVKERIEWAFNHNIKTAKRYHTLSACKEFFAEKLPTLLAKGGQWLEAKAQGKNSATAKGQFTKVVKQTFDEIALIAVLSERDNDEIAFLAAAGIDYFPEAPDDKTQGLGKPVPAADIYKMVTDKIIGMLKSASPTDYHRAWKDDAFFIPINYDSKKPYRGVNRLLLQERIGFAGAFRNPYFLTFKQIKKHKGTLKKGAKGYEVIYYSIRYVVPADKNSGRKAFSSTNAQKVLDFLHKYKLSEDIVGRIPMIRYYNVYNGADIENIDFKLDELQIGRAVPDSATENRAAQLIVENYPNPPAIKNEGNQAYYNPASDYIKLPKQEQFDTVNDYYRTLFHELTHSTGHNKRLNRGIHLMLEKDDYAKEELVAEFGAVFLSAWAGIMWYNNKNHAAYLKGWNSAIKEAQSDNKFLMRAASLAQQATDYILALDKDGNPAFLKKLQGKKASKNTPKTPTDKSAPSDLSSKKNTKKKAPRTTQYKGVKTIPLTDLYTDEKRFQNRKKLNEEIVENIVNNFKPTDLDPLVVWYDEKQGKTFVLAGHHRYEALKRLGHKTVPVKYANDDYPTEADAIRYAKEISNANRTLEEPYERAAIYRKYRDEGYSEKEINEKANIEGKNRSYILNLSYLNPKGSTMSTLVQFSQTQSKADKNEIERIADWIGQARRNAPELTNAHEQEMFDFLMNKEASKRTSTKAKFLEYVRACWNPFAPSEPLNLARMKYQSEGEKQYDEEVENLKTQISTYQGYIDNLKDRFINPSNKDFVNPTAPDYMAVKKIADDKIAEYNTKIQYYQSQLMKVYQNKQTYIKPTGQTALFGTLPNFKTRKEAKKYFKAWAAENLTGKKVYHKELDKYVVFSSRGIDHVLSSNISFNKMKLILQAEEMLKNSHLIAFEEDYKKRENIKGVYRMRSNAILEGEDIKVILTLREGENGVIYYDHKIEEIKESTTPPRKSLANPFCGDSTPTNTPAKTVPNSALSAPEVFVEHSPDPATQSITPRNNSIANKMATLQNRTFETFIIAEPQMQAFLGDVERKNTGSTAITITGGAGSGKTRFAFQFINALAQNYKVGHASLEEQPDSKLYFDKVHQYLDETAQANVEAPEIENMQDLQALIERNDVIVIDSFTKIREWNRNFLLDRDLRKKYNGKLFLIIFQQTSAGNMRGGSESEYDGDIILFTQVFPDYRENYIYPSKNRYNSTPSEQLRYSVYHQQLLPSESTPSDSSPVTSNTYEVIY